MTEKAKNAVNKELDEITKKIIDGLEKGSADTSRILHLTNIGEAKKLLDLMDKASTKSERESGKKALVQELVLTTWMQRLYFVIRSFIMGLISAGISAIFLLYFGSINLTLGLVLGIGGFILSLVISRLFDTQIVKLTTRIVSFLNGHKSLRNFMISHF
jgi:hypothetical protein